MARLCYCLIFLCSFLLANGIFILEALHVAFSDDLVSYQPETPDHTYRTSYHFQPPKNWMNDPNGPMYYKGIYHLFYQFNPKGADFSNKDVVWGHSASEDLVNWFHLSPALYPSQEADISGCWSGSATILPKNIPAVLYTGNTNPKTTSQMQNLAVPKNLSDPFLVEWTKSGNNPVMAPKSDGRINASSFRDPTTAWQGKDGLWRVLVGSKRKKSGLALLYRSKDFVRWHQAKHPLHSAKGTGMWECPDFYPVSTRSPGGLDTSSIGLGIKHVLKISLEDTRHDHYDIGTYDDVKDKFIPDDGYVMNGFSLRYDYGKFYASKTFFDRLKQRRILWGWINESLPREEYIKQGWSGVQGFPRLVWLDKSMRQLMQWPIPEINMLRKNNKTISNTLLKGGSVLQVSGVTASQADVHVSFQVPLENAEVIDRNWSDPQLLCSQKDASKQGVLGPFGLKVLASEDLQEYTAVFFRVFKSQSKYVVLMCSDQSRSSLNEKTDKTTYGAFVDMDPLHEQLSIRSLIDHSIVESFGARGKTCITSRVYPKNAIGDNAYLYVFNNGMASIKISKLTAWSMKNARIN